MNNIAIIAFGILVVVAALHWIYAVWSVVQVHRVLPVLAKKELPTLDAWPKLSVIVPACDEELRMEAAALTLLAVDYPNLEILFIDDRSTDSTGEIVDRLAAEDDRVVALHLTELPKGWLGKPHAMQRAFERSSGEWILFTDADVEFATDSLRRAIAWAETQGIDHLAVVPRFRPVHWAVDSIITGFIRAIGLGMKIWRISDPRSKAYMGVGAFNMVRREAFEKTPGLEWLKMEVTEDLGIGLMMKRSGAQCAGADGNGLIELEWYGSIGEMAWGFEKGFASISGGRLLPFFVLILLATSIATAPALGMICGLMHGPLWIGLAGLIGFLCDFTSLMLICRWSERPYRSGFLLPVVIPIALWMLLRAAVLGASRGGIVWRGTFYSKRDFIAGKRVKVLPW